MGERHAPAAAELPSTSKGFQRGEHVALDFSQLALSFPAEGALLCTVPRGFNFPMPPRSAPSLLGQIAAPLQVLWMQPHRLAHLQFQSWGWTGIDPSMCIKYMQHNLVAYPQRQWVTPRMCQPRETFIQHTDEDIAIAVQLCKPTTVGELAQAEAPGLSPTRTWAVHL